MKISNIHKIYLSNLLTGIVFWYGIEKLFMQNIGISPVGIGIATAALTTFIMLLDFPSGILADKWSRKGTLALSAIALAASSLVMGASNGLAMYIVGEFLYGLYVVFTSGTYNAILYDTLHEEGHSKDYSKISGRAYGLFLIGAGLGNIASGFIANNISFSSSYFLSVIPCAINLAVILSMYEPTFHKNEVSAKFMTELKNASLELFKLKLLRILTVVISLLSIAELFKLEFGQIYFQRYVLSTETIGLLWALFAFGISFGSFIAHRLRSRLTTLIVLSSAPYFLMTFIDSRLSILLFMIQVVAASALINQIETRIQENTPSSVRASILSAVSTVGRILSIPASLLMGWMIKEYSILVAMRFTAIVLVMMLVIWLALGLRIPQADKPALAE